MRRAFWKLCLGAAVLGCWATSSFALTGSPVKAFQVTYFGSGARPMGMGGAFTGLADDPTATDWNPAGCTIPLKPELSLQLKASSVSYDRIDGGNVGDGTFHGLNDRSFSDTSFSVNYAGFLWPFLGGDFSLALSRFETVNWKEDWSNDHEVFGQRSNGAVVPIIPRFESQAGMSLVHYGLTLAGKVHEKLSLGGTFRLSQFHYSSSGSTEGGSSWDVKGSDNGFSLVLGALFQPTSRIGIGVAYRSALKVAYTDSFITPHKEDFSFPWNVSVGVAFRPLEESDLLTITADLLFIHYSSLGEHLRKAEYVFPDGSRSTFDRRGWEVPENAAQPHFGIEYLFQSGKVGIPLRMGYYYEPNRYPWYSGSGQGIEPSGSAETEALIFFRQQKGLDHFTVGSGLTLGDFKADAGANLTQDSADVILSLAYRLPL